MSGWFSGPAPAAGGPDATQKPSARLEPNPSAWSPRTDRARAKALQSPKGQRPVSFTTEALTVFCRSFIFMAIIPFLFAFAYHAFPTIVLSTVALIALFSFVPCMFNNGDLYISLISATMLASTFVVFVGSMHVYWAHVQPLRALTLAREYHGVYPQQASVAFADASYLSFAGSTKVDTSKTVSMKSLDAGLNTFCVAPIANEKFAGRVEFWAVGVDCCGEPGSGQFDCGDAGDPEAKNAYVLPNPTDPLFSSIGKYIAPASIRRDIFMTAIAKAEETEGTSTSKEPLLVRWTKDSKEDIIKQQIVAIVFKIGFVNCMLSAIMAFYLTWLVEQMDETMTISSLLHKMDQHYDDVEEMFDVKQFHPPLSRTDTFIMGIIVPYISMMMCVWMMSFSGCWTYGHMFLTPFFIALGIFVIALLATPSRAVGGLFLLLCSIVGVYIGQQNYQNNMFHACGIEDRRTYSNVAAEQSSAHYWDAGIMKFDSNSYLAQNYSVGFLYKDITYCAAPILSADQACMDEIEDAAKAKQAAKDAKAKADKAAAAADETSFLQRTSRMQTALDTDDDTPDEAAPEVVHGTMASLAQLTVVPGKCKKLAPKQIEFWAIGTNCCGARKDFRCDGAKDANAHSAVLVRGTGDEQPGGARDQFFNAIAQSTAAYSLPVPDRPVLIRWGEDPEYLRQTYRNKSTGLILLTALVGFLTIFAMGICSFFYLKKQRLRQMKEEEEERLATEDAKAKLAQAGGWFSSAPAPVRDQLQV